MLTTSNTSTAFSFSCIQNGEQVPFDKWAETDDCIYLLPLATLVDNGFASLEGNACIVPHECVYSIDDYDRKLLGIPPLYDMGLRLRADDMLNSPDFSYIIEFLTHVPDGQLLKVAFIGNVVTMDGADYLLTEAQFRLLHKVAEFNNTPSDEKTADFNFRSFAEIKQLALSAGCQLDSYLENENVYVPEKIKIEIGYDGEGYTVEPGVSITENDRFKQAFARMRRMAPVVPVQKENGERVRVVMNAEQTRELVALKQSGGKHRTREEVEKLIENPTEFFDPDLFDLSELYSDRVIEIGVYLPKFSAFISPYKSCWVAGATVESRMMGTIRITVGDEGELRTLQLAIDSAKQQKMDMVDYHGVQFPVDDAEFLAETAREQLADPSKPLQKADKEGKKVLIIEENGESLGFRTDNANVEACDRYTLYKNDFLQDGMCLKAHQEEGVAWLQHLYNSKASGCLMADDMGLGKTLQILYFIDWHSRTHPNHKPYLIVAPVSLLENWEREYECFFKLPRLRVERLSSKEIPRKFDKKSVDFMQQQDVILTNYESLRISQLNFCAVDFDVVALDEAQKIKTPGTMVTCAAKALKAEFRIAMTGTPVENSLLDLWCIMDFCVPGLLGDAKSFGRQYQTPLKNETVDMVAFGNEIHEKLGVYFMRRLKADAAKDLPQKIELKKEIAMPHAQEKVYVDVVNDYMNGMVQNMLVTIMNIRTVSEHPYLYQNTLMDHSSDVLEETSARLKATIAFLEDIKAKGEKVILFAERKETQKMLQRICLERYGIVASVINGDTPPVASSRSGGKLSRQTAIDQFQHVEGFNIIIMSPVAAGMGLNVTAANHVIHYSRHWNPAKENQATDRAYRIGQTKDVFVYYPMAVSENFKSFDQTLDELLSRKTTLATSTIFPTERAEVTSEEMGLMLFKR